MTQLPPPPGDPNLPGVPAHPPSSTSPVPGFATTAPAERIRVAWQRRPETDYVFDFWTAFGWTLLTCGVYFFYVIYQLVRRSRDHNARRLELLDAATAFAWEQATEQGRTDELRPNFERIAIHLATMRRLTSEFRDPGGWLAIAIVASFVPFGSWVVQWVIFILLDGDLVTHDPAEGAVEAELSAIYERLGAPVSAPEPSRLKGRHNYVARVIVSVVTCGIYALWWTYDVMVEGNRHFEHNWRWEDELAGAVQRLLGVGH